MDLLQFPIARVGQPDEGRVLVIPTFRGEARHEVVRSVARGLNQRGGPPGGGHDTKRARFGYVRSHSSCAGEAADVAVA